MSKTATNDAVAEAKAKGAEVVPEVNRGNTDAVYPIKKTASFVSRSISSGKRRTYEVAVTAHGHDNVTLNINGGSLHLSGAGVDTICSLLSDVSKEMNGNDRIHKGKARKGVAGDPDFDPNDPAVVTDIGRVLRTEGQNDEVDGVEAKIRAEAQSLANADDSNLDAVAEVDKQVIEDQKKQTEAENKQREAEAKKAADARANRASNDKANDKKK